MLRLRRSIVPLTAALLLIWGHPRPSAQQTGRNTLVGTWTLTSVERPGSEPSTMANPRGVLVFDAAGHMLEIVTRAGRPSYVANQATPADALATFMDYGGFWGSYQVDEGQGRLTFRPAGAVNPNLMDGELVRSFDHAGDRLTVTSIPSGAGDKERTRWTWERVPVVENLSAAHRQLVGFWQHVVERRVDPKTDAVISETRRAPSIIVYTPSGYVGVHFPPLNRKRFAADTPTPDEARAAITGYVGYYGVYLLYPGFVSHHQLATLAGQTTSFRRYLEFSGSEVTLKFPPGVNQGREVRTIVTLKRLSGAADFEGK